MKPSFALDRARLMIRYRWSELTPAHIQDQLDIVEALGFLLTDEEVRAGARPWILGGKRIRRLAD